MIIRSFGGPLRSAWSGLSGRGGSRNSVSAGLEAEGNEPMKRDPGMKPQLDVVWPVEPLGHRDGRAVRQKLELLDAPHVKPLNDWVRRLNLERSDLLTSVENVASWFGSE